MLCCLNPDCLNPQNTGNNKFCHSCGTAIVPLLQNRFRIISLLGSGGFGRTYLAEDTHMLAAHKCVIKQLKPINNNSQIYQLVKERFEREAAVLEQLSKNSDRIPTLYAYFVEADLFYLVQEWIDGDTLANKIQQQGILKETVAKKILVNLLEILDYIHSKRIIHRDIKPDNIIVRYQDGLPVLIDFGAVKETLSTVVNSQGNPTSSIVIGTPGFMPSEQASGRPVYSSDLYSLALTIIYALTGKLPQELESNPHTGEIVWQEHAKNIDPNLIAVLDKAISWHPRERYPSAKAMLDALKVVPPPPKQQPHQPPFSYKRQPTIPVSPPTPPSPTVDSSKKTPILTVATLITVMLGGLGLIAFSINNNPSLSTTKASSSPSSISKVDDISRPAPVRAEPTKASSSPSPISKVDDIPRPAPVRSEPSSQNNDTEEQSNTNSNTVSQESSAGSKGAFIVNSLSGKCIDVAGAPGYNNGAQLQLWDCERSGRNADNGSYTDQKWILTNDGFIRNSLSGKCIDVAGAPGETNGAQLQLWDCESSGTNPDNDSTTDQQWQLD